MSGSLCLLMLLLAAAAFAAEPEVIWVAPDGNDAALGTADAPLATPAGARDRVRDLRIRSRAIVPYTIRFRGGRYELDEPLRLTPGDGGMPDAEVRYEAAPDERPIFSGGTTLVWREVEPGLWAADLPPELRGCRQLFVAGPNGTFSRRYRPSLGAFVIAGLTDAPVKPKQMPHRSSQTEFRYFPEDLEGIDPAGVEVVALHDWSATRMPIAGLDREQNILKLPDYPVYRIGHWWRGGRNPYYLENVREAFDAPGEFYVDSDAGGILYRALPGETLVATTIVVPRLRHLLEIRGDLATNQFLEHLTFRGITFAHTAWTLPEKGYSSGQGMIDLPAAVEVTAARGVTFERNEFAHLGAYALRLGEGCHDNAVVGNRFSDLGGGGVMVGVTARMAEPPVLPTGNRLENNLISDGGRIHFSAHGIWIGIARDSVVRHNLVRRFLYSGISSGWVWDEKPSSAGGHLFETNEIHDTMMLLADGGGFYSLGFQPGLTLRGNLIHNVHRSQFAGSAPNNGFFFDQGSKGFRIEDNIIHTTSGKPVRFNQNGEDWHTWGNNHLGVGPEDPAFPKAIADAAGLEPEYRDLLDDLPEVAPVPILGMQLSQRVAPLIETFETLEVGAKPPRLQVQGEDEAKGALIRVTDETAAEGTRCLKYIDQPDMPKPFYPYCFSEPTFAEGAVTVSFAVRLEPGAVFSAEGRDYGTGGFKTGPLLRWAAGGALSAKDQPLLTVPVGEWVRYELAFTLGGASYAMTVTLPGGETKSFGDLPLGEGFAALDWFGFISHGTQHQVVYLDDIRMTNRR